MEIKWNPYPETKPPQEKYKCYLVTVDSGKETYIDVDEFFVDVECEWATVADEEVTAWAELPEPYKKPVKLKAHPIESIPQKKLVILTAPHGGIRSFYFDDSPLKETIEALKDDGWTHWTPMPEFEFLEEE